jgi:hypothetical protein
MTTLDEYFCGWDEARSLFDVLQDAVAALGDVDLRVTKSQVAWRTARGRAFAWAWIPGRYLRSQSTPLVLTLALRRRDPSPRWKEIVETAPGRFTHHLELYAVGDVDDEVRGWVRDAWGAADLAKDEAPTGFLLDISG